VRGVSPFAPQIEKSGFDPGIDNNRIFVGYRDTVLQYLSNGAFTGVAFNLPPWNHEAVVSGAAILNLGDDPQRPELYVADLACAACTKHTNVGIIALDSDPVDGIGRDSIPGRINELQAAGNRIDFRGAGAPLGICAIGPRQGARSASGTLFVAARNAIYEMDLASHGPGARMRVVAVRLVAGSGTAGRAGAGYRDGAATNARFDFGRSPVGIAANRLFERATALYVSDPGNRAIRRIDLRNGKVRTYALLPGTPLGLTVDPFSGIVYAALPSAGAIYEIARNGTPRIAAARLGAPTGLAFDAQSDAVVVKLANTGRLNFMR
jgi:hypothetical protein